MSRSSVQSGWGAPELLRYRLSQELNMSNNSFPHESFGDLLAANAEYQKNFKYSELTGSAAKGLAIVTCMDSRINPFQSLE
jgi:hypothetical protein